MTSPPKTLSELLDEIEQATHGPGMWSDAQVITLVQALRVAVQEHHQDPGDCVFEHDNNECPFYKEITAILSGEEKKCEEK